MAAKPALLGETLEIKKANRERLTLNSGGDEEDRTPDLRIANATLSQLSYVPEGKASL